GFVDGVEGEGEGPVAENPTDPNPNAPVQPEISEENPFVTMIKTEICKQIPALLLTNAPSIVLDMNGSTNLSNEMLKAMFDVFDELGYSKPVDCVFYIYGKKVVLRIPMNQMVLQNTASILKALEGENFGVAGPDRLVALFANYGFSIIEDERNHSFVSVTGGTGDPSVASINPNPGTGIDPAMSQVAYNAPMFIGLISTVPGGSTVEFYTNDSTFLDVSVVQVLLTRHDISVNLNVAINGEIKVIIIPAGADLAPIVNSAGVIEISTLISRFGENR
ncbi:MAG: hypothetical protein K5871_00185, partial [Lachnospiraceae bacterium]|nr:hypothetical protein [Lachnospiraceae bacterium]